MNATIDIGNTRTKWALWDGSEMVCSGLTPDNPKEALLSQGFDAIICTTGNGAMPQWVERAKSVHALGSECTLPVAIDYDTPETLGADRIAAACGAWSLSWGKACVVIDAGTCITLDFVDEQGIYHGGAIMPGIDMKFRSLHTFTAKLPLLEDVRGGENLTTGRTTRQSMVAGVLKATQLAIEGFVAYYRGMSAVVEVWLTGGDAERLCEAGLDKLERIHIEPQLVMAGMNEILKLNKE